MTHDLISPTALLVAYMRSRTDIPYCPEIAQAVDAHATAERIMGPDLEAFVEFRGPYTELRYKALNAALDHYQADAVLELASGVSPRGLASDLPYLETDLPEMVAAKQKLCESLRPRADHRFASVDVMDAEALERAADSLPGERLAIINEGLLLYFAHPEKERVARAIGTILKKRPGSRWMTTDVYLKQRYQTLINSDPRVADAVRKLHELTGRDLTGNSFTDDAEALDFFARLGLRVERHNQRQLVPRLVLECQSPAVNQSLSQEEVWIMSQ